MKADESYNANGTWVTWDAANKLSLTESGKYVIYARITDNAGNQTVINSDGVVVFKDSVVVDSSIDYTRTTKTSVDAEDVYKRQGYVNGRDWKFEFWSLFLYLQICSKV